MNKRVNMGDSDNTKNDARVTGASYGDGDGALNRGFKQRRQQLLADIRKDKGRDIAAPRTQGNPESPVVQDALGDGIAPIPSPSGGHVRNVAVAVDRAPPKNNVFAELREDWFDLLKNGEQRPTQSLSIIKALIDGHNPSHEQYRTVFPEFANGISRKFTRDPNVNNPLDDFIYALHSKSRKTKVSPFFRIIQDNPDDFFAAIERITSTTDTARTISSERRAIFLEKVTAVIKAEKALDMRRNSPTR